MNLSIRQWQGFFCDAIVFLFTVFFADWLRPFLEQEILYSGRTIENYSSSLGWLYLAAAFAQTAGMWLMRPLVIQQMHSPGAPSGGNLAFIGAIVLLVMHLVIFGFLIIWDGFKYIWGDVSGFKMILPILCFALPTITAIIISFPPKKEKVFTVRDHWLSWLGVLLVIFFDGSHHTKLLACIAR